MNDEVIIHLVNLANTALTGADKLGIKLTEKQRQTLTRVANRWSFEEIADFRGDGVKPSSIEKSFRRILEKIPE